MGKLLKRFGIAVNTALKIAELAIASGKKRTRPVAGKTAKKTKPKAGLKRSPQGHPTKAPAGRKTSGKKITKRTVVVRPQGGVAAWQALRADDFFQHGRDGENDYRTNALSVAKAASLDCIRCRASFGMSDELGMHLVKLEHPERPGYFLERDGWFFQAKGWGVTRWQHDLGAPSLEQAKRWIWLTKAYTKDELQYVVARATPKEVVDLLKANVPGVAVVIE